MGIILHPPSPCLGHVSRYSSTASATRPASPCPNSSWWLPRRQPPHLVTRLLQFLSQDLVFILHCSQSIGMNLHDLHLLCRPLHPDSTPAYHKPREKLHILTPCLVHMHQSKTLFHWQWLVTNQTTNVHHNLVFSHDLFVGQGIVALEASLLKFCLDFSVVFGVCFLLLGWRVAVRLVEGSQSCCTKGCVSSTMICD